MIEVNEHHAWVRKIRSAALQYSRHKSECSFMLTILEVVVSICWVAISIDMTEVTEKSSSASASLLLRTEKSSG